jgi:hypothetical protein
MARRRKTSSERRAEREGVERFAWIDFEAKLAAVKTIREAQILKAPPPDSPGRPFYTNLAFFLNNSFAIPDGCNLEEIRAYIKLIERLDAAGQLKPDVGTRVIASLKKRLSFP